MLKKFTTPILIASVMIFGSSLFAGPSLWAQDNDFTVQTFEIDTDLAEARLSPDGNILAVYSNGNINQFEPLDRYLWLIDSETGEEIVTLPGPTDYVSSVAFSHDNTMLVASHANGDINIWDMNSYELLNSFYLSFTFTGNQVRFLPDNQTLALVVSPNLSQIIFLDIETGYITKILAPYFATREQAINESIEAMERLAYTYIAMDVAPDALSLAVATGNDEIILWNVETGEPSTLRPESENQGQFNIFRVQYVNEGASLIYSNPREATVTIIDSATGAEQLNLPIQAEAFSLTPDASHIAWINREELTLFYAPVDALDEAITLLELTEDLRLAPRLSTIQFSQDGQSIVLSGLFGSGSSSIYTINLGE